MNIKMDGKSALDYFSTFSRASLGMLVLPQAIRLIQIWGNLDLISQILSTAELPFTVALIKMIVLLYNKEKMSNLLLSFINNWNKTINCQHLNIMLKAGKSGRKISFLCIFMGLLTVHARIPQILFLNFDIWRRNDVDANFTLYIEAYFPYDWNYSPVFEITCFIQYVGTFLATVAYTGTDGFFSQIAYHLSGQYHILRLRLLDLVNKTENIKSWIEFDNQLNGIIQNHEHINRCIQILESTFNFMFVVQLLACSLQFCVQGYVLILYTTRESTKSVLFDVSFIVTYLIYQIGNFYIYCYLAEMLQSESLKFAQSAYNCQWYKLPPKKVKFLLFIMQRGRKPVAITAGKFCVLNLALFGRILRTSLGYLSVLITMNKRT
ncbi:odorant receptor 4-like isoform X2 [Leptopilina boulardi]|uniref:odorant receptor 4-like isoform X2 n=1 Tax=Leptopilina boulardi TaxID=63433 RepID=UPI0021F50DC3|nr:odorant receptor 4-like isoform X2 [Leptopilina boulardi]